MATRESLTGRRSLPFQLLDPLRGLAALWVFAYHYEFSEQFRREFSWLLPVVRAGHLGVPMFFVISGYCLMAAVRAAVRDGESVGSFLRRRSLRIYPPYWLSLIVVAATPFVIEAVSALKTGTFVRPSSAGNINLGFLDYGVFDWIRVATLTQVFARVPGALNLQFKFTTINSVYWTLAIEFQFYLVMAVALSLKSRAALWLAAVTALSLPIAYAGTWNLVGIFLPYWPMFATGIVLYLIFERRFSYRWFSPSSRGRIAAAAVVLFVGGFFVATALGHNASDIGFALGFGLMLWWLHDLDDLYLHGLRKGSPAVRPGLAACRLLGLMSYSLYLLHGRLQFLAQQLCRQLLSGIIFDVAAIGTTGAMCYVFYRSCEKPFIWSRSARASASRYPSHSSIPATADTRDELTGVGAAARTTE